MSTSQVDPLSSEEAADKPSRFERLPRELRNQIYLELWRESEPFTLQRRTKHLTCYPDSEKIDRISQRAGSVAQPPLSSLPPTSMSMPPSEHPRNIPIRVLTCRMFLTGGLEQLLLIARLEHIWYRGAEHTWHPQFEPIWYCPVERPLHIIHLFPPCVLRCLDDPELTHNLTIRVDRPQQFWQRVWLPKGVDSIPPLPNVTNLKIDFGTPIGIAGGSPWGEVLRIEREWRPGFPGVPEWRESFTHPSPWPARLELLKDLLKTCVNLRRFTSVFTLKHRP